MISDKIEILEDILGQFQRKGSEYLFLCPKCGHHKRKLSVNFDKKVYKCWVCEYSGSLFSLVKARGKRGQIETWKTFERIKDFSVSDEVELDKPCGLPKEFISLTGNKTMASMLPRKYLKSRGITEQDITWWKMGYCIEGKFKNRIIIPSVNMEGEVDYFIGRSYLPKRRKYMNPDNSKDIVFNELFLDWTKDITIVEGVFDCVVAKNSIPLLGNSLRIGSTIFNAIVENNNRYYIALDSDAQKKEKRIINLLLSYDVEVYKIDIFPYKDVGSMPKEKFQYRKNKAQILTRDSELERAIMSI